MGLLTWAMASLVLTSAQAAYAAPKDGQGNTAERKATPEEVAELQKLQKIAGQPAIYKQLAGETTGEMITTQAFDPYVCTLYPSVVHPRQSSGYGSVGAKPYTKCLVGTPSQISHSSVLYIVEWCGLSWVPMASRGQTGYNTRSLTLTSLEWFCKNWNTSTFVQTTNGTSVQAGRTYYSSVSTVKTPLSCGK
ncbi:hypothetical protein ACFC25_15185 [Pseudarthrobacter sp. NPDC055928]|uniref:hypothetical protein n=1 Tax=Pseudarthrobacter sp. NPDC055928 TaxID=3345661 RepID=UPI0035DEA754